ncbi:hypothetical protein Btru_006662 [Bulinus truncatus]|nr:hypothetical protein Btru_006662 [Bulinus truncatus]
MVLDMQLGMVLDMQLIMVLDMQLIMVLDMQLIMVLYMQLIMVLDVQLSMGARYAAYHGAIYEAYNGARYAAYHGARYAAYHGAIYEAYNGARYAAYHGARYAAYHGARYAAYNGARYAAYNGARYAAWHDARYAANHGAIYAAYNGARYAAYHGARYAAYHGARYAAWHDARYAAYHECGRNNAIAPRIVGGSVTRPTDWPWMVRLVYRSSPRSVCAGVLVEDDTVVTVAHCINGFTASQIDVLVGDHDVTRVDPGEELIPVNSTEISRDYVPGVRGFDFAIIKLARRVNFTATKLAACLPDSTIPILPSSDPNSQCFVTGWGVDNSGQVSAQLRSAPVQLMDLNMCNRILTSLGATNVSQVPTDMICSDTSATRSDACLFDDGGALTCRDVNSRFTLLAVRKEMFNFIFSLCKLFFFITNKWQTQFDKTLIDHHTQRIEKLNQKK